MKEKRPKMQPRRNNVFLFVLFFLSGCFALVYEVSWVRAITLEFGSTTLAVATVLSVFMAGLALGAGLMRPWVDKLTGPLTLYGVFEIGIGFYALITPWIFGWLLPQLTALGAGYANNVWFIATLRFVACVLLLLIPTTLMGATLPILSRFYANFNPDGAKGGGLLYGTNTIGACAGTFLAGFVFLPTLGLFKTVVSISLANLALGIFAYFFGKRMEGKQALVGTGASEVVVYAEIVANYPILIAITLTGFAAMACEVIWTRVLVLVIGSSVYAFSIVLFTFLAGLGIGAAATASLLRANPTKAVTVFYILTILSAAFVAFTALLFQSLPALFLNLFWSWNLISNPDLVFEQQALICISVMLPPALIMGGLFPAAARIVVRASQSAGRSIAQLYSWNTVGSIIGSVSAGFVMIPFLGIRGSIIFIIACYCCGAIVSTFAQPENKRTLYMGLATAIAILLSIMVPRWDQQLMTSAMYNYAYHLRSMDTDHLRETLRERQDLLYYKDGLSATVTVTRTKSSQNLGITINGKFDGSSSRDMANQRLLAHIPLLFHPNPQSVCVIGMGTGCTAGSASLHPLKELDVVEIEAAVVEGAGFFKDDNYGLHDNPDVNIRITDGRLFLRLNPGALDVIISEPSNPWQAGSSNLFTQEFFQFAANSLKENGMFCQWVQLYSLHPDNLRTIVRTFMTVFPHCYLISTQPNIDMLLLGSKQPFTPDFEQARHRMEEPKIRADLADQRVNVRSIYDLAARIRMGPDELASLAGSGPLHTDDLPIIAYKAPQDLYRRTEESNVQLIASHATGIAPYISELIPERGEFFMRLADSYQDFLPGGREAQITRHLALKSGNGTTE
jgi:spermidine synthase